MLVFLLLIIAVDGYYINLDQSSVPFLRTSAGAQMDWSSGEIAVLTDTSVATRISSRGVHFFQHNVKPVGRAIPCKRSPIALCETSNDSYVFPDKYLPRYAIGNTHCRDQSSNRLIITNSSIYDISVCDLTQGYLDVIYWKGKLHYDYNLYLPEWAYVIVAACVLYLVVSLGQNIARIMGDKDAVTMPIFTEVVCLFLVLLLLLLHDPFRVFVAVHDQDLLWFLVGYILFYLIRHATDLYLQDAYVYTFNVILATLMLVTGRLYCSFENPYATIYLILITTRWFHKLHSESSVVVKFSILLDSILISLHYKYSYVPSFWDENFAKVYVIAILLASYVVGFYTSSKS